MNYLNCSFAGNKVDGTGLWLHSSGILGASPDGLLADGKGLVEFKCPYTLRHVSIKEAVESGKSFYLKRNEQGEIKLDKKHGYYHQVNTTAKNSMYSLQSIVGPPFVTKYNTVQVQAFQATCISGARDAIPDKSKLL